VTKHSVAASRNPARTHVNNLYSAQSGNVAIQIEKEKKGTSILVALLVPSSSSFFPLFSLLRSNQRPDSITRPTISFCGRIQFLNQSLTTTISFVSIQQLPEQSLSL
jgi:hypothetical protein